MIANGNTILGLAAATLGLLGLMVSLFAVGETRRWRGRCVSLESSLASLRRELELASSITAKTGRRVRRVEQECASVADRVDRFELRGAGQFRPLAPRQCVDSLSACPRARSARNLQALCQRQATRGTANRVGLGENFKASPPRLRQCLAPQALLL